MLVVSFHSLKQNIFNDEYIFKDFVTLELSSHIFRKEMVYLIFTVFVINKL